MSSEWQRVALDELYEFSSGLSKPRSAFGSGYPFLSFKDVFYNSAVPKQLTELVNSTSQERERCSVTRGDVFLTRTSETMDELGMSCVALADIGDATFNGFTKRLRPKDSQRVVPEFARYYFRSPEFRSGVTAMTSMSTRASLNNEMLSRLYMVLPSHAEQGRIGQALGALDDRISLLRETNKTLESIAQAIFKSWFVDFDPVRAKMEGRQPEGMDEETAALFPDSFEETGSGLLPTGWRMGEIQDLLYLQRGFDLPASQRLQGDYPIIAASGPSGTHVAGMAKAPGVITGRSGVLGKVFLELEDYWPLNTTLWVKEFRKATPAYAYELLRLLDFHSLNAGSAVPTLNRNHVHQLHQCIPDTRCIQKFEEIAICLHERVNQNQKTANLLSEIRDALLPRLISGQLRMPEAQEDVENALS